MSVCAELQGEGRRDLLCATSGDEGRFRLPLTKAGRYVLFTYNTEDGYVPLANPLYMHPAAVVPVVTLSDESPSRDVTVVAGPRAGRINVTAADASTNLPVEDVKLTMCRADDPRVCWSTSGKEGGGKLSALAPLTPFSLRLTAEGYDAWHGLGGADAAGAAVTVAPGQKVELSVFLRRRDDARGRVFHESEKQVGVNLPAPVQLSPRPDAVFDHLPRTTRLEWEAVEGAASYTVEVDFCDGRRRRDELTCVAPQTHVLRDGPPTKGLTQTFYEFNFIGAQPGRWRVWAVDAEGREGFKSEWRTFVYTK